MVAVGLAAPHSSLANAWAVRFELDFAALFAIGMMAAGILTASRRLRAWPWHWLALAAAAPVLLAIAWLGSVWTITNFYWVDLAFGPAIGCLLAALATDRPAPLVRLLDTRPVRSLGSFSYSLYLTHAPVVVLVNEWFIAGRVRQGVPSFLVSVAIVVPATLLFARGFAALFAVRASRLDRTAVRPGRGASPPPPPPAPGPAAPVTPASPHRPHRTKIPQLSDSG